MVAAAGIAPAFPPLPGGANLSQLNSQKISLRGIAPRSVGYRPTALLLSYREFGNGGAPGICTPDTFEGCSCFQDSFLDLPDVLQKWLPDLDSHQD